MLLKTSTFDHFQQMTKKDARCNSVYALNLWIKLYNFRNIVKFYPSHCLTC